MAFLPAVNQELNIFGDSFLVGQHPLLPDIPYGQEGRQAIVYSLQPREGSKHGQQMALKVFKPRFQSSHLIKLARDLTPLAQIPGLSVCHRTVLTPENSPQLLNEYPELNNAMLMPWMWGPTWQDILLERKVLSREDCLQLALALAHTLTYMENMGLAHCDLSAANIILPALADEPMDPKTRPIELVDVEQTYSPQFQKPDALPGGSPGYAHSVAAEGVWNAVADRFAGAVLLVEILAWCSPRVREHSWGESYFDPGEIQKTGFRYVVIREELSSLWGDALADLFSCAWESSELSICPSFRQWQVLIKTLGAGKFQTIAAEQPSLILSTSSSADLVLSKELTPEAKVLIQLADKLAEQQDYTGAMTAYAMAIEYLPAGFDWINTLTLRMEELKMLRTQQDRLDLIDTPKSPHNYFLMTTYTREREQISINKDLFIIGRSQSADYVVMASGISRIHMEFLKIHNRIAARDLNSTNGTYINGRRIEPYALHFINNGDRIKLANLEYQIRIS